MLKAGVSDAGAIQINSTAGGIKMVTNGSHPVEISNDTDSSQVGTGALVILGGCSVAKNLQVGINISNHSDITLKKNINNLKNSLEKVNSLRGVSFDWKAESKSQFKDNIGFIAQEVEEIIPELVSEGSDGIKSVNYISMVSILTEAIKEQQKMIQELQNDVSELKK